MTRFNEITSTYVTEDMIEVWCDDLDIYIGYNLVWDEKFRLGLTYGRIEEVRPKGDCTIVTVTTSYLGETKKQKLSFAPNTKAIVDIRVVE